ncbi:hypothetical protein QBC41DRAFT_345665 [Cercophora samala]|uniref:Uncharacterized protein n=1 Tax=Cercophora samala TaxID=330535 RepID=A0AA39ZFX6_9PEZI|nr:hypothetical protein QBC41DRAFT_345665 [Cercophora samala]
MATDTTYANARVLVACWKHENSGFKIEGEAVGQMFSDVFQYDVSYFAIPSSDSQHHLLLAILACLLDIQKEPEPSLLIVYYGGHADANDNKSDGEPRGSVWAAHAKGGPTLNWSLIQRGLSSLLSTPTFAGTDILLLLDCCYAAQAGRGLSKSNLRFSILAAAAMRSKTRSPGKGSFTSALIQEIKGAVDQQGLVTVQSLHLALCDDKHDLYTTPVYISQGSSLSLSPKPRVLVPRTVSWCSTVETFQTSRLSTPDTSLTTWRDRTEIPTSLESQANMAGTFWGTTAVFGLVACGLSVLVATTPTNTWLRRALVLWVLPGTWSKYRPHWD